MHWLSEGSRVKLVPRDNWNQPMRGWAERGRQGTVVSVFTPMGGRNLTARVRFDRQRGGGVNDRFFAVSDLLPATPLPGC